MRALLVHPEFPTTYWGFQHGLRAIGKRASLPPLGLLTLAALLPREWELRLVDTNIDRLRDDDILWADVVLVGGMLVQEPSMHEVIARARALGRRTVLGGPAVSTSPERFTDADALFGGEVEGREAEVAAIIEGRAGAPRLVPLRKEGRPSVQSAPPPRFDLLDLSAYVSMSIQYSRGCPYLCEFCDIIEIYGRVPRMKTPAQVLAELDALRALGWRGSVFFVDDNFIGNIKEVRKLLPHVRRWQEAHGFPFELYTEASVNLAGDEQLIADLVGCGFSSVFLGIETPSPAALKETHKLQNLRLDLVEAVDRLTRAGLEVMAGFIVGFDSDDASAFEAQRAFLEAAPIPLAMVGILTALPDTALWRRLESEGRLREHSDGNAFGRTNFATVMDEETLLRGYAGLLAELYSEAGYFKRCMAYLERAPEPAASRPVRSGGAMLLLRAIWHLGVVSPRRSLFWKLVGRAARVSMRRVPWAIEKAVEGEHFLRYTSEDVLPRLEAAIEEVRKERRSTRAAEAVAAASLLPARVRAGVAAGPASRDARAPAQR
jgi:radical SAM superfamily enzyme YgiQ (UPF0313 family)